MEAIRRFRLDFCDLPTMIENVDVLLRIVNVKIVKSNDRPINIIILLLWVTSLICYYHAYIVSTIWFVFIRCPETGDLIAASLIFSLAACSQPSFITMFQMIIYKKKVQGLIENVQGFNYFVKPDTTFSKNIHTHLRYIKKRAMVVWITMVVDGMVYILIPIIMPGRHLPEDLQIIYGLEPMFKSPNFEIAMIITALGVYICVFSLANVTAMNIVILGYIEAQMIALSKEIKNVWNSAEYSYRKHAISYKSSGSKTIIKNIYVNEKLKEIIYFHVKCIEALKYYDNVFNVTKAIEFLLIVLGIISELLGGVESTYLEMLFTVVLISIECISGQKLKDASMMFERAVYDCKWENFDINNRKTILFMLPSAQRTLKITAGGTTPLDFRCMLAVFRFSYSTYNTLRLMVK
ncbi:unnamed protein product [Pieris macdunnoughi]|uniref:Odorant receptor n=1 Tax=Pieris macdunnoughi TaxID=345717 RepID=A0A821WKH9_9NEOP|nr:unnamed protein product [Pieris macdunnoughi]